MSALAPENSQSTSKTPSQKSDEDNPQIEIFLGGSCNPTTWRQNVAIPFLESNGITYYNPQVDNWTPEAVNLEHCAKQKARVLLFVIDKQTRSTVSIVETAFIATQDRHLVLVIFPFDHGNINLCSPIIDSSASIKSEGQVIKTSRSEMIDYRLDALNPSPYAAFVESTTSESSSSTTTSVSTLISSNSNGEQKSSLSSESMQASSSSSTFETSLTSSKTKKSSVDGNELRETQVESIQRRATRTTNKSIKTSIRISGESISWLEFQELQQARDILQCLVTLRNIPIYPDILQALNYVSTFVKGNKSSRSNLDEVYDESKSFGDHSSSSERSRAQSVGNVEHFEDVYLSLDSDDYKVAQSNLASQLEEKGLTYRYMCVNKIMMSTTINSNAKSVESDRLSLIDSDQKHSRDSTKISSPSASDTKPATNYSLPKHDYSEDTRSALEEDLCAIKNSRVLLFVITNRCRGLSIMVLASHFMALSRDNVVLCVQDLEEPCCIHGELLTNAAIADYNRGRVYLCDYAVKAQVPVFNTIQDAVECCKRKCQHQAGSDRNSRISSG